MQFLLALREETVWTEQIIRKSFGCSYHDPQKRVYMVLPCKSTSVMNIHNFCDQAATPIYCPHYGEFQGSAMAYHRQQVGIKM